MKDILYVLFRQPTNRMQIQLFRYLFVGGAAFVFDFVLLYLLTAHAGLFYLTSASISFLAGLFVNYILSILWVFPNHSFSNRWLEFGVFAAVGIVGLGLNDFFMWFFTGVLGFYFLYSKILATIFVFMWNFFARKLSLFR